MSAKQDENAAPGVVGRERRAYEKGVARRAEIERCTQYGRDFVVVIRLPDNRTIYCDTEGKCIVSEANDE